MALSKDKKQQVIEEVEALLATSKLTAAARYAGTSVSAMQDLRRQAKDDGTKIKVIKNRLFKKALQNLEAFKELDSAAFGGQLIYAFNEVDEVASAQSLAAFAKTQPQIEFVAGLTADGQIIGGDDLKALAALPSKDQLRSQAVAVFAAPMSGVVSALAGNVRGILNVLNARAESQAN
jgi:large subunit ribosomal protein L10